MSKYTIIDDPTADTIIDEELSIIVSNLIRLLNGWIQAILLTGGFGRGEGAVVREGGAYRPVNDYDIIVVVKRFSSIPMELRRKLPELEESINKEVSVKQVDLAFIDAWKLAIPYPTIARYEITNGYKLLYGYLPYKIRAFPANRIPLYEAITYFRTRACGLLLARLLLDGYGNFSEKERSELSYLEINKAFLALGDAYLIENHSYHFLLLKRKETIIKNRDEFNISEEITNLYLDAIQDKFYPKLQELDIRHLDFRWFYISKKIIQEFLRFENKRHKKVFKSIINYYYYTCGKKIGCKSLMRLPLFSLYNREDSFKLLKQRLIAFILLAYKLEENDMMLSIAKRLLNLDETRIKWEECVIKFLTEWHQTGIIKRLKTNSNINLK